MDARITDLEIRLTHQESTLEELNDTIIHQQRDIDKLQRGIIALTDQLRSLQQSPAAPQGEETPPPHY